MTLPWDTIPCVYDVKVYDKWDSINFTHKHGQLMYMQIKNEGPYTVQFSLPNTRIGHFSIGNGETQILNGSDLLIKEIEFKLQYFATDPRYDNYSIIQILGSYRARINYKKYRSIDEPFEISMNQ